MKLHLAYIEREENVSITPHTNLSDKACMKQIRTMMSTGSCFRRVCKTVLVMYYRGSGGGSGILVRRGEGDGSSFATFHNSDVWCA